MSAPEPEPRGTPELPAPPRLSRRLLEWTGPRLGAPELVDDAGELFAQRARRDGIRAARRWYRRQAGASVLRVLPIRLPRLPEGGRPVGLGVDARLGVRMLVRYPGLALVGVLGMAFAIFVGAATFEVLGQLLHPTLPFPGGDRIVGVRYWDRAENEVKRPTPSQLAAWLGAFERLEDVGAFHTVERNLAADGATGRTVTVARMSPAGFRAAGVRPLLGRTLLEADARAGSAPVAVVGQRLWREQMGGDPSAVGGTIRLDGRPFAVVGVMPGDFVFPGSHDLWLPLRHDELPAGAELKVFGRLAPGASLAEARAEVAARVRLEGGEDPGRRRLAVEVLPFPESVLDVRMGVLFQALVRQLNLYPVLFLVLVASNVALLMFARAAARTRELVVRSALGAGRRRIVTQLVVEAMVLGGVAAALGLALTGPALGRVLAELEAVGASLTWVDGDLSPSTALWVVALTVVGALVAGGLPGLKATGRGMETRLRQADAGAGGLRLGGVWTAVVVAQVAATVVFTGAAWGVGREAVRNASVRPFFPAERYLVVRPVMEPDGTPGAPEPADTAFRRRYAGLVLELRRRMEARPGVAGTTVAERLPVKAAGSSAIEIEPAPGGVDGGTRVHEIRDDRVGPDFFDLFPTRVVAGRTFGAGDSSADARVAVVNASFAEEVLGGRGAVGRRFRYVAPSGTRPGGWYEIVGVVDDLVADRTRDMSFGDPPRGRVYHPLDPATAHPLYVVAHVPGGPEALAASVHALAEGVDPALRLEEVERMDRAEGVMVLFWRLWAILAAGTSGVAVFLSLASIYAVMSFTVARRTREIGVRLALGAAPRRLTLDVFRGPLRRVAGGAALGCVLLAALGGAVGDGLSLRHGGLLLALGVAVLAVCSLACVGPTLRALRVEPAEALSADG